MVFNEIASPRSGIIQNIERVSGIGLGGISNNASPDYLLEHFLGKVNEWVAIAEIWASEANDEILFDDDNNTGGIPEEYDFSDDTQIYELDSDITQIRKVEFRNASTEDWFDADYYLEKDRIEDLYGQDSDAPSKYFLQGRNLITNIPVDIAKTDKYRITYSRTGHDFVIGDTTAEAGFDARFHWILVYGPVMDWTGEDNQNLYNKCYSKIFGRGEGDENALKTMLQASYTRKTPNVSRKIGREKVNYS